jgi:signal peptidase I
MRSARLDRRVRKEARALVKEARVALLRKKDLKGKGGNLGEVTAEVEKALDANDLATLRARLPVLDSLIDELVVRKARSGFSSGVESLLVTLALALSLKAFVIEAFKIPSSSMYPTLEIGDHIFVNKFIYGIRIPWTTTKVIDLGGPSRGDVIVFMQPCTPDRDYIKRVVALAGDTIEVRCSVVWVNGKAVPQELVEEECSYQDRLEGGPWRTAMCSRYRETVNGHSYDTFQSALRPSQPPMSDNKDFPMPDAPPPSCIADGQPAAPNQLLGKVESSGASSLDACAPFLHYVVPPGHVFAMGDNRANSNDSRFWGSVPIENIKGKAMFIWFSYPDRWWDATRFRWSRIGNFVD